jgi:hypothetical protein
MLLPTHLPFKLKQAEGRNRGNVKARACLWAALVSSLSESPLPPLPPQKLKHILAAEEYHLLPPSEPTCASSAGVRAATTL